MRTSLLPGIAVVVASLSELAVGDAVGANEYSMRYGNVFPMCLGLMRAAYVDERIADLRRILEIEEGDVCAPAWPNLPFD